MPSTSKSNRQKGKRVPKPKQEPCMKNPTRNWLELPSDLMVNILQRIGVKDILENAQRVCTVWHEICKDPALWRVVYLNNISHNHIGMNECKEMCKHAVDRSQGQLVDLTVIDVLDNELLQYDAAISSKLRRLEIMYYYLVDHGIWSEAFKKFPLLEELSLLRTDISQEDIEAVGRYCPLLKTLKVNQQATTVQNQTALAIAKNLPQLTHLELIGSSMKNTDLQAILDGCCHLQSLDLCLCNHPDLNRDLGKICSQKIKYLKLPSHYLEWSLRDLLDDPDDEYDAYCDCWDDYDTFFDHNDTSVGAYDGIYEYDIDAYNDRYYESQGCFG